MSGLVISIGGKLDPTYKAALVSASSMAAKESDRLRKAIASANLEGQRNTATHLEMERYQQWLEGNVSTLKTVKDAREADARAALANSAALKQLNAELAETKRLASLSTANASSVQSSVSRQNYMDWWVANSAADPDKNAKIKAYFDRKRAATGYASMGSGMSAGFAKLIAREAEIGAGYAGGQAATGFLSKFMEKMKGSGGSGMSQLISVFSNTASSLGAGISPARIFAQQAPNFIQAFTLMSKNAFSMIMRFLFNPFTWAITGMVAVAAGGAYLIYRHFKNLSLGLENVANKFGLAKITTEGLNKAMKSGEDVTRSYQSWMDKLGKSTETLGDVTEKLLKKMREQARLERELARARGASPQTLTGMEIDDLQREINVLEKAHKKQQQLNEDAKLAADLAAARLSSSKNSENLATIENASKARDAAAATLDAVKAKSNLAQIENYRNQLKLDPNASVTELVPAATVGGVTTMNSVTVSVADKLRALEETIVTIDENGIKFRGTLADAEREFKGAVAAEIKFQKKQDSLNRALKEKQDLVEQGKAVDKSLTDQIEQLKGELGLKKKYGPQLDTYSTGGSNRPNLTSAQQAGGFALASMNFSLLTVNQRSEQHLSHIRTDIAEIKTKGGGIAGFNN